MAPQPTSTARLSQQHAIDAAAWDVFAEHQPYYHVLCDPRMLDADAQARDEFWASGGRDVGALMEFADQSAVRGVSVDFGCGLGRLTRALVPFSDRQIGIDISSEMVGKARALNAGYATVEFRHMHDPSWPIDNGSASLVISLLVFNHLSTADLMEYSLGEVSRVLCRGGVAVLGIQTMTWRGEMVQWLRRLAQPSVSNAESSQAAIRKRLVARGGGEHAEFSDEEILEEMFHMEFRQLKSIPLRRLHASLRAAQLTVRRLVRNRQNGGTFVAVQKA